MKNVYFSINNDRSILLEVCAVGHSVFITLTKEDAENLIEELKEVIGRSESEITNEDF